MDTMKDTKMQPAKDAVINTLRKMQPTAWIYEDMLGRKCVGFERPLHRRNTHEPLFSAATHAVVMELVNRLEAAEKERNALRAKIAKMEKQEPVWFIDERGEPKRYHKSKADYCKYGGLDLLYALPGAKGEKK